MSWDTLRRDDLIEIEEEPPKGQVLEKPCKKLRWCPYGELVEYFPLCHVLPYHCQVFGHYCPAFYASEVVYESE